MSGEPGLPLPPNSNEVPCLLGCYQRSSSRGVSAFIIVRPMVSWEAMGSHMGSSNEAPLSLLARVIQQRFRRQLVRLPLLSNGAPHTPSVSTEAELELLLLSRSNKAAPLFPTPLHSARGSC